MWISRGGRATETSFSLIWLGLNALRFRSVPFLVFIGVPRLPPVAGVHPVLRRAYGKNENSHIKPPRDIKIQPNSMRHPRERRIKRWFLPSPAK